MSLMLSLFDILANKDRIVKAASQVLGNDSNLSTEDAKAEWLKNFKKECWGINLVIGKSGGGKTAFCARIAEFVERPTFALNMLKTPQWITQINKIKIDENEDGIFTGAWFIFPDGGEVPAIKHCSVIIDDAANILESNKMYADVNQTLKKLAFIARHLDIAFFVNVQDSSSLNKQVVGQARTACFKEPALFQFGTDRDFIAMMIEKEIKPFFDNLPKEERKKWTYIYCSDYKGVIKTGLAKGWTQAISENKG